MDRNLLERQGQRMQWQDAERLALAEQGQPLGQLVSETITIVKPDTMLQWRDPSAILQ